MTDKEIFKSIISEKKWYGGLRTKTGSFHSAQSANRIKYRFEKGVLNQSIMHYIIAMHGWVKTEVWVNTKVKEAEYQSSFNTDK